MPEGFDPNPETDFQGCNEGDGFSVAKAVADFHTKVCPALREASNFDETSNPRDNSEVYSTVLPPQNG